jgi:type II secretory ATPase GspE/PulE/Tfp pilus assembly ATPase PilB-like protein
VNPETSKEMMVDVSKFSPEIAVARLVEHAADMGASDLFLVSNVNHVAAEVRHLGIVNTISLIGVEQGKKCLSYIKANAAMDMTEKRRPLDGRWIYKKPNGDVIDLRINVIPTLYGEDFAIRLLTRGNKLIGLENLGLFPEQMQQFTDWISSPSGLILITGPTGSGKTATQYAALAKLNNGQRKINTIEDPIEYAIDGLRQSQVNPAVNLGFGELLRSVLRQSPDVIMIGEIRDEETARTAVYAANSGMLVFATLHAPHAAAAVQAMRSLGSPSPFLASSLRGVLSQRLVRTLDPATKVAFDFEATGTFDEIKPWLAPGEGTKLYAAQPAPSNHMTGYAGRTGVFEVLPVSKAVRQLITDEAPTQTIRDKAIEEKMLDFRKAALLKVARGETSTEEVLRVIPSEHLLTEMDETITR